MPTIHELFQAANTAFQNNDIFKAHDCFIKALQYNSKDATIHSNIGACYIEMRQWKQAFTHFQTGLELNPNHPAIHTNLSQAYRLIGRMSEAAYHVKKVIKLEPDSHVAQSNFLLYLNYCPEISPKELYDYHQQWGLQFPIIPKNKRWFPNYPDPDRPLRVGYISPDLRGHSVGYFIEPALIHYDKKQFEIFCYAHLANPDATSHTFKNCVQKFRMIHKMDDLTLANQIRADGIDILVDLAGHTANSRIRVMIYQPAPIQVTYLGYPATSGLKHIDYRLTDSVIDPPGETDTFHTEQLLRLKPYFFCLSPLSHNIPVSDLPSLKNNRICFGGFHNTAKVSEMAIALWSNILVQKPDASLLLQASAYNDPDIVRYFQSRFESYGIDKNRIKCMGKLPFPQYLKLHDQIDIMLDTFPWTGHTTACHALWMGIPTLTLEGTRHASRIGARLMRALDLHEWVATDHQSFIEKAVRLTNNTQNLQLLRKNMRKRILQSGISQKRNFTQSIENTFRQIWQKWCQTQ